jgi:hypothetical protein
MAVVVATELGAVNLQQRMSTTGHSGQLSSKILDSFVHMIEQIQYRPYLLINCILSEQIQIT